MRLLRNFFLYLTHYQALNKLLFLSCSWSSLLWREGLKRNYNSVSFLRLNDSFGTGFPADVLWQVFFYFTGEWCRFPTISSSKQRCLVFFYYFSSFVPNCLLFLFVSYVFLCCLSVWFAGSRFYSFLVLSNVIANYYSILFNVPVTVFLFLLSFQSNR